MRKNKEIKENPIKLKIQDIRTEHLNKLIEIKGKIIEASGVRPRIVSANFKCKKCGKVIRIKQLGKTVVTPKICSCGACAEDFNEISKDLVDSQRIVIQDGKAEINVILLEDLCDPENKIIDSLDKTIKIVGTLELSPTMDDFGNVCTRFDWFVQAEGVKI